MKSLLSLSIGIRGKLFHSLACGWVLCSSLYLISSPASGHTVWGAQASGLVAQQSTLSGFTSPVNSQRVSAQRGTSGFIYDMEQLSDEGRGSYDSEVTLTDEFSGFMTLRTRAETFNSSTTVWADAHGVASFTYTGAEAASFEINLSLSGTFSDSGTITPFSGSFLRGYIIDNDTSGNLSSFENVIFGMNEWWVPDVQAELFVGAGSPTPPDATLSFEVQPGDTFLVYIFATSRMHGPSGLADAFNTSLAAFSSGPTEDLVVNSIPEPRFAAFGAGLAVLLLLLRRRIRS